MALGSERKHTPAAAKSHVYNPPWHPAMPAAYAASVLIRFFQCDTTNQTNPTTRTPSTPR